MQAPPGQFPGGAGLPQEPAAPQPSGGSRAKGVLRALGTSVVARLIGAVVGVAVIAGGGFLLDHLTGAPSTAKAGDCVKVEGDTPTVVECTAPEAEYQVVARLEDKTEVEFHISRNICCRSPGGRARLLGGQEGRKRLRAAPQAAQVSPPGVRRAVRAGGCGPAADPAGTATDAVARRYGREDPLTSRWRAARLDSAAASHRPGTLDGAAGRTGAGMRPDERRRDASARPARGRWWPAAARETRSPGG